MLLQEVDELYAYWAKFPPVHEGVRLVLVGLGLMEAPKTAAPRPQITDDEVEQVEALRLKWGSA